MGNFNFEFKGLSLSMGDMAVISDQYEQLSTAEYIMDNYNLPFILALRIAGAVRDRMNDYDDDTEAIEVANYFGRSSIFIRELAGIKGAYNQKKAQAELEEIEHQLSNGEITIDKKGIAYNKIGRPLSPEMVEKLNCITKNFNIYSTGLAYDEYISKSIEDYKLNKKPYTEEELSEMRNAFGEGTTVIDTLTGEEIIL